VTPRCRRYRYVDDLALVDLLIERPQLDGEGNHYKTCDAALEAATIRVEDGDLTVDISTAAAAGEQDVDDSPTPDGIERSGSGNAAEEIERPSAEK